MWVEASPSLLGIETWAMSGGATMWGLLNSYFAAHPGEANAWLPTYDEYMDTYCDTGPERSPTPGTAGMRSGISRLGRVLGMTRITWTSISTLTDFWSRRTAIRTAAFRPVPRTTTRMDQTWVSNYLGFMGLDGMLPPAAGAPAPAIADLSAPRLTIGANPVFGAATLAYALPQPGPATLEILDVAGRSIARLDATAQTAGAHALTWLGVDADQRPVPAGAYFAVLRTAQGNATQRIVWVR